MKVEERERTAEAPPPGPAGRKFKLSSQWRDRIISITAPVGLLIVWELVSRLGLIDARFFPPPTSIVSTFVALIQSGELLTNTWISIQRLFIGFLIGAVPAIVLGLIMGVYRNVRVALDPIIAATYPIPKTAIFPLLLLIFGLGETSKWAIVAIGVFFPIVMNTAAGVREIEKIYHDVGNNFGAGSWQTFRTIALPGALPLIIAGMEIAVGMALMLIVVAEMLGGSSGLGYMIWNSWQTFNVETMYVGLVVISILGVLFTFALTELESFVMPWRNNK